MRYGQDGPGIQSWWGREVPYPSRLALKPTQPPVQWYWVTANGTVARVWS